MNTISTIVSKNLCISCGACAGNCPQNCITFSLVNNMYLPVIGGTCINCGMCLKVCPSEAIYHYNENEVYKLQTMGEYRKVLCAKIRDNHILSKSTSGGAISGILQQLLVTTKEYDAAFVVKEYDYHRFVETEKVDHNSCFEDVFGSRYLPVSQRKAIKYMLEHRDEKIIFVATPCCTYGILKSIDIHHLKRDNYLILGLFCDKTMNYGVQEYFDNVLENKGRIIQELHFRSKSKASWPGNVLIKYSDNTETVLPSSNRKNIKDYYVPERCLYCLDKLNTYSDISFGDNYIRENADVEGVSSIIIRTERGLNVWDECQSLFMYHEDLAESLLDSQLIKLKADNLAFGSLKGIYKTESVDKDTRLRYRNINRKRKIGLKPLSYKQVKKDIRKQEFISKCKRRLRIFTGK